MRRMMQGREKTRENQFVQPNTVPVASVVLMNFHLSLFLHRSLAHARLFLFALSDPSAQKLRIFRDEYPLSNGVRSARDESGRVG